MTYSIFYSWQSDSPSQCNRGFIRKAIDTAIASLGQDLSVLDSPRVESGMEGIGGTPEVATVMLTRIKRSAIFIGDMTLTGKVERPNPDEIRLVPNPNVSLELGYAAGVMGWGRIICVINEFFGKREQLPFDVRNRRFPINYSLGPDASPAHRDKEILTLSETLKFAIKTVAANEYEAVSEVIERLDVNCLNLMSIAAKHDWFLDANPSATIVGGVLDTAKFSAAVIRLLDLGLLQARIPTGEALYAYHWTYLGAQALVKLGFRRGS